MNHVLLSVLESSSASETSECYSWKTSVNFLLLSHFFFLSGLLQQGALSCYDDWYGAGQSLIWESQSPWTLCPTDSPLIMMCSWLIELLISLIQAIKKKHCVWWMRSTHWFWFTSIYFNHSLMETFLDKKVTLWPPFIWQFWVEQVCEYMCNGIWQS